MSKRRERQGNLAFAGFAQPGWCVYVEGSLTALGLGLSLVKPLLVHGRDFEEPDRWSFFFSFFLSLSFFSVCVCVCASFVFSGPHLRHMEVPRLGVESEL